MMTQDRLKPPPHLNGRHHQLPGPLFDQLAREAQTYVDSVAERLRGWFLRVQTWVVINRPAAPWRRTAAAKATPISV